MAGRDDAHAGALDDGQEVDELVQFAGVGEGKDGVFGLQEAEIAVHGLGRVQGVGGGAGAGEGGGDFLADVEGLADAGDDDFHLCGEGSPQQFDGLVEFPHPGARGCVAARRFRRRKRPGLFQMGGGNAHGKKPSGKGREGQGEKGRKTGPGAGFSGAIGLDRTDRIDQADRNPNPGILNPLR